MSARQSASMSTPRPLNAPRGKCDDDRTHPTVNPDVPPQLLEVEEQTVRHTHTEKTQDSLVHSQPPYLTTSLLRTYCMLYVLALNEHTYYVSYLVTVLV